jgi:ABC-type nickel/cobalt efflux system permease component RcnA
MPVLMALLTAYLLGIIHGVTPDEHTWPITFSYSIGSYSARQGMKVGFAFSLAFTLQRAIMSELAYLVLDRLFHLPAIEYIVYVVVGAAMIYGGFNFKTLFHWYWKRQAFLRGPDPRF